MLGIKEPKNVIELQFFNMIAYKLVRQLKDGSITSLFINKSKKLPFNEWLEAEPHLTKGYAFRQGWHCTLQPKAPHLTTKGRVWVAVEVSDYEYFHRPKSQGGVWLLAQKMKILYIVKDREYLKGVGRVGDDEFNDFAEKNGRTPYQVLMDMVLENWTQGRDTEGNFEYWEND